MTLTNRIERGRRPGTAARRVALVLATIVLVPAWALAADVTKPAEVTGLLANRSTNDVSLTWSAVTTDADGNPETMGDYRIYRGTTPDFVPDRAGGSNRIGETALTQFTDTGAVPAVSSYYYLVSAVDAAGNEGSTKPPTVTTPPVLSGNYTDTGIDLSWTDAQPLANVTGYRVYYGPASHQYQSVVDVGLVTHYSLTGIASNVNWYSAVTAIDQNGNESAFSNEHVDCVGGRITLVAHDDSGLCWLGGGQVCPPNPGEVQRNGGFQLMVPVSFPEGAWTKVTVTYTLDSRLCTPPAHGTTDKCGNTNPGGTWNPCGDPWDRTAHLFLVLDNCIDIPDASCITNDNLELMRAITPFGTDAPPPDGSGVVPPRVLTLDITPYTPLLTGFRYVGAEIANFATAGWHVTSQFYFSKRPEEASPKPPAHGIQVIGFQGAPLPVRSLAVPASATQVKMRLFTTGHGGTQYCDGGSNDGGACTSSANCPGGSCQNCDEFCHRTNRILKNGSAVYTVVPWVNCCVPKYPGDPFCQGCSTWDACGFPSCAYNRAGWCPGNIACTATSPCDQDLDMTASFPPGGTYNVGYDVLVQRGSWPVSLVAYWY